MNNWTFLTYITPEADTASDSEYDSDSDIDYAIILQGLVRRYTNSLVDSTCPDYPHFRRLNHAARINVIPNTTILEKSEFTLSTKVACGLGTMKRKLPRNNVVDMMLAREKGLSLYNNFSYADKCTVNGKYLPNAMDSLQWHNGKVFCCVFSKDGEYCMTAAQDRRIVIYDTEKSSYKKLNEIRANEVEWSIIDVAFCPNQEHIVYSTWSPSLLLCSIHDTSGKQEMLDLTHAPNRFCAFSVAFSANGGEVLAGASDGCIYIYDLAKRQCTFKIAAHDIDVNTVALANESSQIICSGGDDALIKVWDRRTLNEGSPKPVGILAGHMDGITYIDSRGDGRHFISNSKDQSIKLWDIRAFSSPSTVTNTAKALEERTWDYRWQNVPRKLYKEAKMEGDTSVMTYRGHVVVKTLIRCKFSPIATTGQRYIYTGCGLGRVVIYDALTGKIKGNLAGHTGAVRDASWHPYRNEIVSSGWDGLIGRWTYKKDESCDSSQETMTNDPSQNTRRSERLAEKRRREQ